MLILLSEDITMYDGQKETSPDSSLGGKRKKHKKLLRLLRNGNHVNK